MVYRNPDRFGSADRRTRQALTNPAILRRRLALVGIALFFVISAFDIHRWRVDEWRTFQEAFDAGKAMLFGIPPHPVWLYALAFPVVAVNFWCLVQIARGKSRGLLPPFIISASVIAVMPLFGGQGVIYRIIWPDILTLAGYAIGGTITVLLVLDSDDAAARTPREHKD